MIRILIVDDLAEVRRELATLLVLAARRLGIAIDVVGEAKDGLEAVQEARRLCPDVVLMDLEMPGLDGFEATRRIKADRPAVRLIILSIHAGSYELERARAAGADGFIVKGAGHEVLLQAILAKDGSPNSFDFQKGEKK